jgi:hypothetical protein
VTGNCPVHQAAFNSCYLRLLLRKDQGRGFDLDTEFTQALAEHKKQRRMEIDTQIAALLKERDSL